MREGVVRIKTLSNKDLNRYIALIKDVEPDYELGRRLGLSDQKTKDIVKGIISLIYSLTEREDKKTPYIADDWSPALCPSCLEELSNLDDTGYYIHAMFLERCPNPDCVQRLSWEAVVSGKYRNGVIKGDCRK